MIRSRDHGIGGAASTTNVPPVAGPGAGAAFVVSILVNGAGAENENAEFSVTDCPALPPFAISCGVVPAIQVWLLPPVKIPIAPSTRRRTLFGSVEAF